MRRILPGLRMIVTANNGRWQRLRGARHQNTNSRLFWHVGASPHIHISFPPLPPPHPTTLPLPSARAAPRAGRCSVALKHGNRQATCILSRRRELRGRLATCSSAIKVRDAASRHWSTRHHTRLCTRIHVALFLPSAMQSMHELVEIWQKSNDRRLVEV